MSLEIRVNLNLFEMDVSEGTRVLANVYSARVGGRGLRGILVPAGPSEQTARFQLEPGAYTVEAIMPSGVLLSEDVVIREGEDSVVVIDASDSPHESHSWQYLVGNIESRTAYDNLSTMPWDDPLVAGYSGPGSMSMPQVHWIPDSSTAGWSFHALNKLAKTQSVNLNRIHELITKGEPVPIDRPTESDGISSLYRFDSGGPVPMNYPMVRTGARQFVLVHSPEAAYLVTLPNPWRDYTDVQCEVMVHTGQSRTRSAVAVGVRDRELGAALGYLANGALPAAARLFGNVEDMLYGKVRNPLAAAAAAYVLVGTETDRSSKPWHSWLAHLRSWFGWMSDGSIVSAKHILRSAESEAYAEEAKEALIEAYDRGVPFYTHGLSWLIDGLSEFPDDEDCARRLEQVRRLSWRVDMRQPFVVLKLNGDR